MEVFTERVKVSYYVKGRLSKWTRGPFPLDRLVEKGAKMVEDASRAFPGETVTYVKETVTTRHEVIEL